MGWWEIERERVRWWVSKRENGKEGKRERANAGVEGRKRGAKNDVEERQSRGSRRTTRVEEGQWREGGGKRVEARTEKRQWLKRDNERSWK